MTYVEEDHVGGVYWEWSRIRSWLNSSFYEEFTLEEKALMNTMKCHNVYINPIEMEDTESFSKETKLGYSQDNVSLLSYLEAKKLPKSVAICGKYWWVRSTIHGFYHQTKCLGCGVHSDGSVARGFNLLKDFGVRPIIQLNLNKFSQTVINENDKKENTALLYKTEKALKSTLQLMKETRIKVVTLLLSFLLSILGCISTFGLVQAVIKGKKIDEYIEQIFEFCRIDFIPHTKVLYIILYISFTIYSLYLNRVDIECESGWKVFIFWIITAGIIPGIAGKLAFPVNMYHYIQEYSDLKRSRNNYMSTINGLKSSLEFA